MIVAPRSDLSLDSAYGAAEIAATCAEVRALSADEPMPPRLLLIALWIEAAELPFLPLPWHPLQYWV